jgi:hypothetical protein
MDLFLLLVFIFTVAIGLLLFKFRSDLKALDVIIQTIFLAYFFWAEWIFLTGGNVGHFLYLFGDLMFYGFLAYQVITSAFIVAKGLWENNLSRLGLSRLAVFVGFACLIFLSVIANRNFWDIGDLLTFSHQGIESAKSQFSAAHLNWNTPSWRTGVSDSNSEILSAAFIIVMILFYLLTLLDKTIYFLFGRKSESPAAGEKDA